MLKIVEEISVERKWLKDLTNLTNLQLQEVEDLLFVRLTIEINYNTKLTIIITNFRT